MDEMMFYHANSNGEELSVIDNMKSIDIELNIGKSATVVNNTFAIVINELMWEKSPIFNGDMVYVPGEEWGGIVTQITHKTSDATIKIEGITWRGFLYCMAVEPPVGEAYLTFTDVDANEAISLAIGNRYPDLIVVSSQQTGVNVSGQWRYKTVANCLNDTLSSYGMRLKIVFDNTIGKMILSAEPVNELTEQIELSQDYGVDFTSKDGKQVAYNRILALGKGELLDRLVRNVYYLNGSFYTEKPQDWDDSEERTLIYDYSSVESESELIKSAIDKLSQNIPVKSISINQITANIPAELGDVIGARDRMTGMVGQATVVKKIMKLKDVGISIEMGVE